MMGNKSLKTLTLLLTAGAAACRCHTCKRCVGACGLQEARSPRGEAARGRDKNRRGEGGGGEAPGAGLAPEDRGQQVQQVPARAGEHRGAGQDGVARPVQALLPLRRPRRLRQGLPPCQERHRAVRCEA